MIEFGRELCGDVRQAAKREWLVTNGIGGYALGTVAGILTRRYHGLLIAALDPPLGRTLLLAKLEPTAFYDGNEYRLYANEWVGDVIEAEGTRHLERFHLEGTTPVWTFACADALLEKRVWMQPGSNTTYIHYRLTRATRPLTLQLRALVNYRPHHALTRSLGHWMRVEPVGRGVRVVADDSASPFYLLSARASVQAQHQWYRDFYLREEADRGLDKVEDHLCAAEFNVALAPGESVTIVASTEATPNLDGKAAYQERTAYEADLLAVAEVEHAPEAIRQLTLAADQFVVRRRLSQGGEGYSVIAGYPWFADWGRDTMIALPGLTLNSGQHHVACQILRTFAGYIDRGMLPNTFPEAGEGPQYNTADATLWFIEAVRAYVAASHDTRLLREIFPVLQEILAWHQRGTRYGIQVDFDDGLLRAGEPGVQLTWMDAKVGDWVVTPRVGKPVEINALWYNALRSMTAFAQTLDEPAETYARAARQVKAGFARFWNAEHGYCYDVIDGPEGADPTLRPNQLFAVSLRHSPLTPPQQRAVVDVCARRLLTAHGLRSLTPEHPDYVGHYGGGQRERDGAYHQGTVWAWLIGPFVSAHLRVYRAPAVARSYLVPLLRHLRAHGVGTLSEIFDGDAPFLPRGCIAQAWSVAEVLRVWHALEETPQSSTASLGENAPTL
ncbi:MAG: amylo-alpha-1,6-glucosidase [Anaerolineae bacterium]